MSGALAVRPLSTTCPAAPAGGSHRWLAWRKPVLGPLAEWICTTCGATVTAPADASGCAPDLGGRPR